jgi:hypothetical protein
VHRASSLHRGALLGATLAAVWVACAREEGPAADQTTSAGVVDSIFPIEEEIRRFRAEAGPDPRELLGADSREALIDRFIAAVERADTSALRRLPLNAEEFIYLYYPHTRVTASPYELSPSLLWFQIQNEQSRGLTRLLARFAGAPLRALGHHCEPEPRTEGPNRVWEKCVVLLRGEVGDTLGLRLFGTVLERDGAFRLVSLSNDL